MLLSLFLHMWSHNLSGLCTVASMPDSSRVAPLQSLATVSGGASFAAGYHPP